MSAIGLGWLYLPWGAVLFETYYGLMQQSPFEIKEKLLKALDKEYNVLDMATVLEMVSILERTPITREALQSTRLGRDINELRRKTKNEYLAKRAKVLVRRWRDLIAQQQNETAAPASGGQTDVSQQNGASSRSAKSAIPRQAAPHHPPLTSPAVSLPASDKSSVSPVLSSGRVEAVPKTHAANKRLRKDAAPSLLDNERKKNDSSSPELPSAKRPKTESQTSSTREPRVNGDHYDSVGSDCEIVSVTPATRPNKEKSRKKNKSRKASGNDIVKEKIASIARIPKVKTTKELLAGLKSRANDAASNSSVTSVDHDVARNKTEHIARFLRSQSEDVEIIDVESQDNEKEDKRVEEDGSPPPPPPPPAPRERTAEEILARLPPLDLDSIDWSESPLPSPKPPRVTDEDVDQVLNQRVEGLNGNYDTRDPDSKVFREWHELVTRTSYNGDNLHILPYVVID